MNDLDVNECRRRLMNALGESSKSYFAHLKAWFCMRINKEDFDRQARLFLPSHLVHLHNEFLLAVLTKCQSLCQPSSYIYQGRKRRPSITNEPETKKHGNMDGVATIVIKPIIKTRPPKSKAKPAKINFENRFQPVDPVQLLSASAIPSLETPRIGFCSRDLTLPDSALIHGRILVAAWDVGLDQGCEDKAIELILVAVKHFMKQLLMAIVAKRKGYKLRENRFIHSVGLPTLNPWLHNSWVVYDRTRNSYATDIDQSSEPPHIPAPPQTLRKAERDSAFFLACAADERGPSLKPISTLDLFQTLQVQKNIIPCHTVYSVNMERISARLYHPDESVIS